MMHDDITTTASESESVSKSSTSKSVFRRPNTIKLVPVINSGTASGSENVSKSVFRSPNTINRVPVINSGEFVILELLNPCRLTVIKICLYMFVIFEELKSI